MYRIHRLELNDRERKTIFLNATEGVIMLKSKELVRIVRIFQFLSDFGRHGAGAAHNTFGS